MAGTATHVVFAAFGGGFVALSASEPFYHARGKEGTPTGHERRTRESAAPSASPWVRIYINVTVEAPLLLARLEARAAKMRRDTRRFACSARLTGLVEGPGRETDGPDGAAAGEGASARQYVFILTDTLGER